MALPQHAYRDPLEQLLRAESVTCRGCTNQIHHELLGTTITTCSLKDADGRPRKHGRRCKDYDDGSTA